jgi:hypothetical protein
MYRASIFGDIAGGSLCPKKTPQVRKRNGEKKVVYFVRFHIWAEKQNRWEKDPKDENKRRRPKELVQVILPENEGQHNVFDWLEPGRKVLVEGDHDHRPGFGKPKDGSMTAFANPIIFAGSRGVQLLDSQWSVTASRVINFLQKQNMLEEDKANEITSMVEDYFSDKNPDRPPSRIYEELSDEQRAELEAPLTQDNNSKQQSFNNSTPGF